MPALSKCSLVVRENPHLALLPQKWHSFQRHDMVGGISPRDALDTFTAIHRIVSVRNFLLNNRQRDAWQWLS
jgi:hypothetical protein